MKMTREQKKTTKTTPIIRGKNKHQPVFEPCQPTYLG